MNETSIIFKRPRRMAGVAFLLVISTFLASCNHKPKDGRGSAPDSAAASSAATASKTVTIASFNSLHLGWNNQKDTTAYCGVLAKYDVIGLVEVMNTQILDRVRNKLDSMTDVNWAYAVSDKKLGPSTYNTMQ
jgi:hypothetical protein